MEISKTTDWAEEFFCDVMPWICYNVEDVVYQFIEEGSEFIHGLLACYATKHGYDMPYKATDFKFEGAELDNLIMTRVVVEKECGTSIRVFYIVFQLDEDKLILGVTCYYVYEEDEEEYVVRVDEDQSITDITDDWGVDVDWLIKEDYKQRFGLNEMLD